MLDQPPFVKRGVYYDSRKRQLRTDRPCSELCAELAREPGLGPCQDPCAEVSPDADGVDPCPPSELLSPELSRDGPRDGDTLDPCASCAGVITDLVAAQRGQRCLSTCGH